MVDYDRLSREGLTALLEADSGEQALARAAELPDGSRSTLATRLGYRSTLARGDRRPFVTIGNARPGDSPSGRPANGNPAVWGCLGGRIRCFPSGQTSAWPLVGTGSCSWAVAMLSGVAAALQRAEL